MFFRSKIVRKLFTSKYSCYGKIISIFDEKTGRETCAGVVFSKHYWNSSRGLNMRQLFVANKTGFRRPDEPLWILDTTQAESSFWNLARVALKRTLGFDFDVIVVFSPASSAFLTRPEIELEEIRYCSSIDAMHVIPRFL